MAWASRATAEFIQANEYDGSSISNSSDKVQ
jgi:hypothetical protein